MCYIILPNTYLNTFIYRGNVSAIETVWIKSSLGPLDVPGERGEFDIVFLA
jgi:hypothetical protein